MKSFFKLRVLVTKVTRSGITVLFLLQAVFCMAKQVTKEQSINIARQFYSEQRTSKSFKVKSDIVPEFKLNYISKNVQASNSRSLGIAAIDTTALYYVYNIGQKQGFVIISGDDRAVPVLGYSDEGSFDTLNVPLNFKYWLSIYENEIKKLASQHEDGNSVKATKTSTSISKVSSSISFSTFVNPLLGSIQWNQDTPYNDLCPLVPGTLDRTITGCVATAMAQVMKYYQWPVKGTGSNSYTTASLKIPLSVDFSTTTYDWANMTPTYGSSSSEVEKNAVAILMYHCGVSMNMDYNLESGAYQVAMGKALKTYFGYDANLQILYRDYYKRAEWVTILKTELNAARPILYGGSESNVIGHEFVCDGYDSNDFFHINWGWGGQSNGYFQLSALNPDYQGWDPQIGGFDMYQDIVIDIQKPSPTSEPSYEINMKGTLTYSAASVSRNGSFTIGAGNMYNFGLNTFTGTIGIALYDSSNIFIKLIKEYSKTLGPNTDSDTGWDWNWNVTSTLNSTVLNGNYKLYFVYKGTNEINYQIVRGYVGTPNYLNVQVTSTKINFSSPTNAHPILTLNSLNVTGNLYQNEMGTINASITNTGAEYNSTIEIRLTSKTDKSVYQILSSNIINIATGETRNIIFNDSVLVQPGEYFLAVNYDGLNNANYAYNLTQLGSTKEVNVLAPINGEPIFKLNSSISFPDATKVFNRNAILTANITNAGAYYNNKVIAFILPSPTGNSLTYIGYQDVVFDTNQTKSITFEGSVDLPLGNYCIGAYYKNSLNNWVRFAPNENSILSFTLVDNATALFNVNDNSNVLLYPNPATNVVNIKSEETVKRITITDLIGNVLIVNKPNNFINQSISVGTLKPGTYIIKIDTESETKFSKFIKK